MQRVCRAYMQADKMSRRRGGISARAAEPRGQNAVVPKTMAKLHTFDKEKFIREEKRCATRDRSACRRSRG